MDVGRVPAVGGGGVVGAGRGDAHQIGQRPHQHIVAGARPGFVGIHHPVPIHPGVEVEIRRHPAGARRDPVLAQRTIEVFRAVGMAGIADVVIVLGGAGQREGIMPPAGILNDLDQRHKVLIEVFRMQTGQRIGMAHGAAGGGDIKRMFDALVELAGREALKIGALAAVDIDDLQIVPGLDEIALRGGGSHPQIKDEVGQGVGQLEPGRAQRSGADQMHGQRGCGVLRAGCHVTAGGGDDQNAVTADSQVFFAARRGVGAENPDRPGFGQINAALHHPGTKPRQTGRARGQQRLQSGGVRIARLSQNPRINAPVGSRGDNLARLAAFIVDDAQPVAGMNRHQDRPATFDQIALDPAASGQAGRLKDPAGTRRTRNDRGVDHQRHRGASRYIEYMEKLFNRKNTGPTPFRQDRIWTSSPICRKKRC